MEHKIAFILAATDLGTLIVNRYDFRMVSKDAGFGVGFSLLETAKFEPDVSEVILAVLHRRRKEHGDGVVVMDCGANIGAHTIAWAQAMRGWGQVIAIEAQERLFYALAGNITLNNLWNARAFHAAVGSYEGVMDVPVPDYTVPSSFGSLEMRKSQYNEFIGQEIDYTRTQAVRLFTIDSMGLTRLDLLKIDVEGMEIDTLIGAENTVKTCRPAILVECIKSNRGEIEQWLKDHGYAWSELGLNLLALFDAS